MTRAFSLAVCALLAPAIAGAESTAKFPGDALTGVRVVTESGNIRLDAGDGKDVTVDVTGDTSYCDLTTEVRGDELVLEARKNSKWTLFSHVCKAGFMIEGPARLIVHAESGAGDMVFRGFKGAATLKTGAGTLRLKDVLGNVDADTGAGDITGNSTGRLALKTGSGEIRLDGLSAPVDAQAGRGDISLTWEKAPAAGTVSVQTGSGNAVLNFPADSKFHLHVKTVIGNASSVFEDAPDAALDVSAQTALGNVTIGTTTVRAAK